MRGSSATGVKAVGCTTPSIARPSMPSPRSRARSSLENTPGAAPRHAAAEFFWCPTHQDFLIRSGDHMDSREIKETVREKYGQAALRVLGGERGTCGDTGTSGACGCDPVSSNLYDAAETATLPEGAVLASLGCGNPTALVELHEGEVVLDLGSGGGIDVLLSARRVGPTGKA